MLKKFILGTVITFMTVPFCLSQNITLRDTRFIGWRSNPNNIASSLEFESNLLIANLREPLNELKNFHVTPSFISPLLEVKLSGAPDTLKKDTTAISRSSDKKFRMKKSPWLAVGFSAVLPGLGQLYNQSYWKVPIILGLSAYLGYQFYDNHKKYADYRDQYAATQSPENPFGDESLKDLREFYRGERDDFVWYFTIVYVINLVDAYVDAHLFDFDVREEKIERFGKVDKEYKLNVKVNF